jgi:hypothetical protein
LAKKAKWTVCLGRPQWERHTYERDDYADLRLLGSVRRGEQFGALAINREGQYQLVVGDHCTALNTSKISGAIAVAAMHAAKAARTAKRVAPAAVPVVIKRRRIPVLA